MHRVLAIPYLLKEIFTCMTTPEVTVVARVNYEWFASSIPILWREVDLKTALSLLGALENDSGLEKDSYRFEEVLDAKKWNRFVIYSSNVLSLTADQKDYFALEVALRSRPLTKGPLFPQCRYLTWVARNDRGLVDLGVLITANLDHFVLQVHDLEYSFFYRLCERLTAASPILKFLHLDILTPSDRTIVCQDLAQNLLSSFARHLRFVQFPEVFNTPTTLQTLRKIPKLGHLTLGVSGTVCDEHLLNEMCKSHNGQEGFRSLGTLSFAGPQESLCDRFLNLSSFAGLHTVRWYLDEKLSNVDAFIRSIVEGCPQLQTLDVGHSRMYDKPGAVFPVAAWSSVQPLLRCVKLRSLALHCFQVAMNSKDLLKLLTSRTTWTSLEIFTVEPQCMNTLFLIAKHCPNLKNLGLFIDGSFALHQTPTEPILFSCLSSIDFVFSQFPQDMVQSVATFFFQACREPPYVGGWDYRFCDAVTFSLAERCIEQEKVTGVPMSLYTREFVANAIQMSKFSEDADMEMFGVDSEFESGSEFEDDEDGMVIDDAL